MGVNSVTLVTMDQDPACVFCRIIAGDLPSHTVFENEYCVAFLDVNPVTDGHVMVVPRHHCGEVEALPAASYAGVMEGVARVSAGLRRSLNASATTIGINNGPDAGQVVPHVHVHLFPRTATDGGASLHAVLRAKTHHSLEEVSRGLQAAIGADFAPT